MPFGWNLDPSCSYKNCRIQIPLPLEWKTQFTKMSKVTDEWNPFIFFIYVVVLSFLLPRQCIYAHGCI